MPSAHDKDQTGDRPKDGFLLLANPVASAGRAARLHEQVAEALSRDGYEFESRLTERPRHAASLVAEALDAGASGVCVIGGDGTFSEAANGFFDGDSIRKSVVDAVTTPWFAPFPCGTGGDFRRTLTRVKQGFDFVANPDIPSHARRLVARFTQSSPKRIDVGFVKFVAHDGTEDSAAFLNIASFGLGGLVDELVNKSPKFLGGRASFFIATVRALLKFEPPKVQLRIEGEGGASELEEATITNVAIANGRYFGGGMHIAPLAELDDGLLDVVSLQGGLGRLLQLVPKIYRGGVLDGDNVSARVAAVIHASPAVSAGAPVLLDVDGECLGRLPARFSVVPDSILIR